MPICSSWQICCRETSGFMARHLAMAGRTEDGLQLGVGTSLQPAVRAL
ncbi:MAG: hypothetical protein IT371_31375 [Deltaproteobacteria bacterium]|nr:hypothetical protein [Deltaproteobacteria bacterium]